MRLTLCNGSPRGRSGNTPILEEHFARGVRSVSPEHRTRTCTLGEPEGFREALEAFGEDDAVLLGFPLYVDAMPSGVKAFLEVLGERRGEHRPVLLFLVHSGFPEGVHTRLVGEYLERAARRLACPCGGVMRFGGSEGIRQGGNGKALRRMEALGREFGTRGHLDPQSLEALAGVERLSSWILGLVGWASRVFYWDRILKKNGAFDRRFDRPLDRR